MSEVIVTIAHVRSVPGMGRKPGYCASGTRTWWVSHGLDWSDFLRNGIPASTLEATGDGLAIALAAYARNMEAARGQ